MKRGIKTSDVDKYENVNPPIEHPLIVAARARSFARHEDKEYNPWLVPALLLAALVGFIACVSLVLMVMK